LSIITLSPEVDFFVEKVRRLNITKKYKNKSKFVVVINLIQSYGKEYVCLSCVLILKTYTNTYLAYISF